ncbi:type 2 periplasmic-binding domain-containing protein [Curvivirga aplysinae]|uniref:hypothetical protein n=1 Tax=Curvivirga aplysinae TaxID=2529852 RepID=UPI0012BB9DCA|nr:hypothetical protein [Curvivirga aplysinae]MTI11093.1 hypothetical protein [Curvivirga aplysinae]
MRRSSQILALFLSLLTCANSVKAEVILHLYELDDRLTPEEDRGYNLYLKDLLNRFEGEIEKKYAPIKRNSTNFIRDFSSCAFPANIRAIAARYPEASEMGLLSSKAVDAISVYVYVPRGIEPPHSIDELKDLPIGHVIGNVAAGLIQDKAPYLHAARNNENLMKMLKAGRIEAIIGFHPDIAIAFDDLGYHDLIHSTRLTLFKATGHFVCHDTPENRRFISYVDQVIPILAQDGRAQEYLGRHAEIIQHDEAESLQN